MQVLLQLICKIQEENGDMMRVKKYTTKEVIRFLISCIVTVAIAVGIAVLVSKVVAIVMQNLLY